MLMGGGCKGAIGEGYAMQGTGSQPLTQVCCQGLHCDVKQQGAKRAALLHTAPDRKGGGIVAIQRHPGHRAGKHDALHSVSFFIRVASRDLGNGK